MSKKRNAKKRKMKKNTQAVREQAINREQEKQNVKTLMIGAVLLGVFMFFFAFEIDGQTLFEKLTVSEQVSGSTKSP
jgi:hypothetical protein